MSVTVIFVDALVVVAAYTDQDLIGELKEAV
jgi:hypothetical protein